MAEIVAKEKSNSQPSQLACLSCTVKRLADVTDGGGKLPGFKSSPLLSGLPYLQHEPTRT